MKKILITILALITVFSLVGCNNNKNENENEPDVKIEEKNDTNRESMELPIQYKEYIDEFKKYMFNYQYAEDENITDKMDISYLYIYDENIAETNCKYALIDLNNDGVKELLMYVDSENKDYENIIYDIYTIVDNKLVHVLSSAERDRYMLYNDGIIYEEGASSAFESIEAYYKLGTNGKLNLVEQYETSDRPEEEYTITKTTIVNEEKISQTVSEDELEKARNKYTRQDVELYSI